MGDVYLYMTDRHDKYVARTIEATVYGSHTGIMVDLDAEGHVIGVEVLNVDTVTIGGAPVPTERVHLADGVYEERARP